jgi:hypothetical protein
MKIRIIGGRASAEHFEDNGAEIWGLNGMRPSWVPHWDGMFNLHTYQRLVDYGFDVHVERTWAQANPAVPFYVMDRWPGGWLPNQHLFPANAIMHWRSESRGRYHCSSFDWLVAFALYSNDLQHASIYETGSGAQIIDEIIIQGVGLCLEAGEPISARACLEYWCGVAEGAGVKVTAAPDCDIFRFYHLVKSNLIYGVDDTPIYEDRTAIAEPGAVPYTLGRVRAPKVGEA